MVKNRQNYRNKQKKKIKASKNDTLHLPQHKHGWKKILSCI